MIADVILTGALHAAALCAIALVAVSWLRLHEHNRRQREWWREQGRLARRAADACWREAWRE